MGWRVGGFQLLDRYSTRKYGLCEGNCEGRAAYLGLMIGNELLDSRGRMIRRVFEESWVCAIESPRSCDL